MSLPRRVHRILAGMVSQLRGFEKLKELSAFWKEK